MLAAGKRGIVLEDRLTSVRYRNFMSFADGETELGTLVVLVGPNGTGKSNFIEGLRFLQDALTIGLDAAITNRGGIELVRRKQPRGRPPDIRIEVKGSIRRRLRSDFGDFSYSVSIRTSGGGDWHVSSERCRLGDGSDGQRASLRRDTDEFTVRGTNVVREGLRPVDPKVLALQLAGMPFRRIVMFLRDIGTYGIYPDKLKEPQRLLEPRRLDRDGRNLASVLRRLRERRSPAADRIRDALADLVPGVTNFRVTTNGGYAAVSLALRSGGKDMWYDASQLSDGTLRLLGIITAIHQRPTPPLIAIEEPELTVHPGAAAALTDELVEAAERTQVLLTTHSPDIVARMPIETLRVVEMTAAGTKVGRVSTNQIAAVKDNLFSPGDLIRIQGLRRELKATG